MMSDCLIIECNRNNEYRTNASFWLFGLFFKNIDVKIDTGCSHTTIPVQRIGLSKEEALALKVIDSANDEVRKQISFGVNDSRDKKEEDKQLLLQKKFMDLHSVTYEHIASSFKIGSIKFDERNIRVSYDRVGNILIGMDILNELDIHMGKSKENGKQLMIACRKDRISSGYMNALKQHFRLSNLFYD